MQFILTIRILGLDSRISFQRFTFSFSVNGFNAEQIFVAFLQTSYATVGDVRFSVANLLPSSSVLVHLLHKITCNGLSTIIFRRFPLQLACGGGNVTDNKGTLNKKWKIKIWNWGKKNPHRSFSYPLVLMEDPRRQSRRTQSLLRAHFWPQFYTSCCACVGRPQWWTWCCMEHFQFWSDQLHWWLRCLWHRTKWPLDKVLP